jgi:flagellar motor switch protein FliM
VNEVPLELRAVLGKKKLTVQEFLKMKRDSVIITDSSVDEPIDLTIMDVTKLRGKMGIWRGNKAVKIEQILN